MKNIRLLVASLAALAAVSIWLAISSQTPDPVIARTQPQPALEKTEARVILTTHTDVEAPLNIAKMQRYVNLVELYLKETNRERAKIEVKSGVVVSGRVDGATPHTIVEWLDLRGTDFIRQMWSARRELTQTEYWHVSDIHKKNPHNLKVSTTALKAIKACGGKGVKELTPDDMEIDYQASFNSSDADRLEVRLALLQFLKKNDALIEPEK